MASKFVDMKPSPNFFEVVSFLLSGLVTGRGFMSISLLVLELRQFSFVRDWPEIPKLEILPPWFYPISGDWGKFHVNIITGSGAMIIFLCNGLTRNPRTGNTPALALLNIWRLGQVRDTKFGTNVSNEMLLNAANFISSRLNSKLFFKMISQLHVKISTWYTELNLYRAENSTRFS